MSPKPQDDPVALAPHGEALKPGETITRFILSSPARFVGVCDGGNYRIEGAYGDSDRDSLPGNRHARHYLVVGVEHEKWTRQTVVAPDHSWLARNAANVAAAWYGKQFVHHGQLQGIGGFQMPRLSQELLESPNLGPFNTRPRPDLGNALNLQHLQKPFEALINSTNEIAGPIGLACHHYNRGLRAYNSDPEAAYLHLVSALEILAEHHEVQEADLYDADTKAHFNLIATLADGHHIVTNLKARLRQLKRRVANLVVAYARPRLFEGNEATDGNHAPLVPESLEQAVKAAYDVRSRHLHAGIHFGEFIRAHGNVVHELQIGMPIHPDAHMERHLARAPTFLGLERITRFTILSFMHHKLEPLHDHLV